MTSITTKPDSLQPAAEMAVDLFDNWFDPIETEVRARSREFIEELIRGELDAVLARPRYGRSQMAGDEASADVTGHRHGSRTRSLTGTFGPIEIAVPRADLQIRHVTERARSVGENGKRVAPERRHHPEQRCAARTRRSCVRVPLEKSQHVGLTRDLLL